MSFGIGNCQLSLANASHAAQNEHWTVGRFGLGLESLLHFLQFGLTADKQIYTHIRSIDEIQA
jgi:hypothetical protein